MAEDAALMAAQQPLSVPADQYPPPLPEAAEPADGSSNEIGFQNKVAVRIGAILAGPMYFLINFLAMLPGGFIFVFAGLFGAGFLSVAIYRQRTGSGLSVISGARMGWICGMFVFLIALVLLTVVATIAASGDFAQVMQEQLKRQGQNAAEVQKLVELLSNPAALLVLGATFFVMITTVPSLGGALGAKMLDTHKEQR